MIEETKPINILLIASGDLWAGAEAVVHQLAVGLYNKPSVHLSIVLLNPGRLETLCREAGIDTYIIDESRHRISTILWKLINICRNIRPDIIHSHRYKENLLAALASLFCGRPKLLTTIHGMSEGVEKTPKGTIKGKINKFLLKRIFDKIVAVSDDIAGSFTEKDNIPTNKLIRILNGIDVNAKPLARKHPRIETFTIGSAGRLFPVKDYPLMVEIARLTCAERANARFVLAGEGPEKDAILQKIKAHGLENRFTLLGHVDNMQSFYAGLDIYINTSMHEGIPMTVLEAMARRIPVVAFAVGGLKEIVSHGHDGYLVVRRDAQEFSRYLIELMDDYDRLNQFGENAGNTVQIRFSNTQMAEGYCSIYTDLLKENRVRAKR